MDHLQKRLSQAEFQNRCAGWGKQNTAYDLLSGVRQIVMRNESLMSLIKMDYTVDFV